MPNIVRGINYSTEVELARHRIFDPMADNVAEDLITSLHAKVTALSHLIGGAGLNNPGTAFLENVTSTIHTVSLLYNTLFGNVLMDIYGELQRKHTNELQARLRRQTLTEKEESSVRQLALRDLESSLHTEEAKVWTLHRVNLIWDRTVIAISGPQVLQQGVVLLWGAFEVLCADLLIAAADAQPNFLKRIVASEEVRQNCTFKVTVPDWNEALWTQNREKLRMTSIASMSTAYNALLPAVGTTSFLGNPLFAWFSDPQLNILAQKRHCIVHKAAVKDADYLSKSSDTDNANDKLIITPNDFRCYAETVTRIGTQLLQAIDAEL